MGDTILDGIYTQLQRIAPSVFPQAEENEVRSESSSDLPPVDVRPVQSPVCTERDGVISAEDAQEVISEILGRRVEDNQVEAFTTITNIIVNQTRSTELTCLTLNQLRSNASLRDLVRFAFEDALSGRPLPPMQLSSAADAQDNRADLAALAASKGQLESPITQLIRNGRLQLRYDVTYNTNGELEGYRVFLRFMSHEEQVAEYRRGQGHESERPDSALAQEVVRYWQGLLRGNRYLEAHQYTEGTFNEATLNAYRTFCIEKNLMLNFYRSEDVTAILRQRHSEAYQALQRYEGIMARYAEARQAPTIDRTDLLRLRYLRYQAAEDLLNRSSSLISMASQYQELADQTGSPRESALTEADRQLGQAAQAVGRDFRGVALRTLEDMLTSDDPLIEFERQSIEANRNVRGSRQRRADKRGEYLRRLTSLISNLRRWRNMAQCSPELFSSLSTELDRRIEEIQGEIDGLPERESRWVREELSYLDTEVMQAIEENRALEAPNQEILYNRYERASRISERIGDDHARQTAVGIITSFIREADLDRAGDDDDNRNSLELLQEVTGRFLGTAVDGRRRGGLIASQGHNMMPVCRLNFTNEAREALNLGRFEGGNSVDDFHIDGIGEMGERTQTRIRRMLSQLYSFIAREHPERMNDQEFVLGRFREILEDVSAITTILQEIPATRDGRINAREIRFTLSIVSNTSDNQQTAALEMRQQLDQAHHAQLQRDFPALGAGSSFLMTPLGARFLETRMVNNFSEGGTVPYSDIVAMRDQRPRMRPLLANFPEGQRAFICDLGIFAVPQSLTDVPDASTSRLPLEGTIETRDPISFARELRTNFLNLILGTRGQRRITNGYQLREFGRAPGELTAQNLRGYIEIWGENDSWLINPNSLRLNQPESTTLSRVVDIIEENPNSSVVRLIAENQENLPTVRRIIEENSDEPMQSVANYITRLINRVKSSQSQLSFTSEERNILIAVFSELRILNGTVAGSNFSLLGGERISRAQQRAIITFLNQQGIINNLNEVSLADITREQFLERSASLDGLTEEQRGEIYTILQRAANEQTSGILFNSLEQEEGRATGERTNLTTALDELERALPRMTHRQGYSAEERRVLGQLADYLSWGNIAIRDSYLIRETPSHRLMSELRAAAEQSPDRTLNETEFREIYRQSILILRRSHNQAFAASFRTPEQETAWEGVGPAALGFYRHAANAATQTLQPQHRTDFRASGLPSDSILLINMILYPELQSELDDVNLRLTELDTMLEGLVEGRIDGEDNALAQQVSQLQSLVQRGGRNQQPGRLLQILQEINQRQDEHPLHDSSRARGPLVNFQSLVQDTLVRMNENPREFVMQANELLHQVRSQQETVNRELEITNGRIRRRLSYPDAMRSRGDSDEVFVLEQIQQGLDLLSQELTAMVEVTEREIPQFREKSGLERRRENLLSDLQDERFDREKFELFRERFPIFFDNSFWRRMGIAGASIFNNDHGRFDGVDQRYTGRFPGEILEEYFRENPDAEFSFQRLAVTIGEPEDRSNAILALQQVIQMIPTQPVYVEASRVLPSMLPMRWQMAFPGGCHGMFVPVRDLMAIFGRLSGRVGEYEATSAGPQNLQDLLNVNSNWYQVWFSFVSFMSFSSAERGRMNLSSQVYMALAGDQQGREILAQMLGDSALSGDLSLQEINRPVLERFMEYQRDQFRALLQDENSHLSRLVEHLHERNEIHLDRDELLEMLSYGSISENDLAEVATDETSARDIYQALQRARLLHSDGEINDREFTMTRDEFIRHTRLQNIHGEEIALSESQLGSIYDLMHHAHEEEGINELLSRVPQSDSFRIYDSMHETQERQPISRLVEAMLFIQGRMNEMIPEQDPTVYPMTQIDPHLDSYNADIYNVLNPHGHRFNEVSAIVHRPSLSGEILGETVEGALGWLLGEREEFRHSFELEMPFIDLRDYGINTDFSPNVEAWVDDGYYGIFNGIRNVGRDLWTELGNDYDAGVLGTLQRRYRFLEDAVTQGGALALNFQYVMGRSISMGFADFWGGGAAETADAVIHGDDHRAIQGTQITSQKGGHTAGAFSLFESFKGAFLVDPITELSNGNYSGAVGKGAAIYLMTMRQGGASYFSDALRFGLARGRYYLETARATLNPYASPAVRQLAETNASRHFANSSALAERLMLRDAEQIHRGFTQSTGVRLVRNLVVRPARFVGRPIVNGVLSAGDGLAGAVRNPAAAAQALRTSTGNLAEAVRNPGTTITNLGRSIFDRARGIPSSLGNTANRAITSAGESLAETRATLTGAAGRIARPQVQAGLTGQLFNRIFPDQLPLGQDPISGRIIPRSLWDRATGRALIALSESSTGRWVANRLGVESLLHLSSRVDIAQLTGRLIPGAEGAGGAAGASRIATSGINRLAGLKNLGGAFVIGFGGGEIGEDAAEYVMDLFGMSEHSVAYEWISLGGNIVGGIAGVAARAYTWPITVARAVDQLVFASFLDGYDRNVYDRTYDQTVERMQNARGEYSTLEHVLVYPLRAAQLIAPNLNHVLLSGDGWSETDSLVHDDHLLIDQMQTEAVSYLRDHWLNNGLFNYDGSTAPDREFFRTPDLETSIRSSTLRRIQFRNYALNGHEVQEEQAFDYLDRIIDEAVSSLEDDSPENLMRDVYGEGFELADEHRQALSSEYNIPDVDDFVERVRVRHLMSHLALLAPERFEPRFEARNATYRHLFDEFRERTSWESFEDLFGGSGNSIDENANEIVRWIIQNSRSEGSDPRVTSQHLRTNLRALLTRYRELRRIEALRAGAEPTKVDHQMGFVNRDGSINEYVATDRQQIFRGLLDRLEPEMGDLIPQEVRDLGGPVIRLPEIIVEGNIDNASSESAEVDMDFANDPLAPLRVDSNA
jgi:hypothetical protein